MFQGDISIIINTHLRGTGRHRVLCCCDDPALCAVSYGSVIQTATISCGRSREDAALCDTAPRDHPATHVHHVCLFRFSLFSSLSSVTSNKSLPTPFGAVAKAGKCKIALIHARVHRHMGRHSCCFINQ